MNYNEEVFKRSMFCAEHRLTPLGWKHLGNFRFEKDGKVYDLSAANLDLLDQIVEEGLFLVKNV